MLNKIAKIAGFVILLGVEGLLAKTEFAFVQGEGFILPAAYQALIYLQITGAALLLYLLIREEEQVPQDPGCPNCGAGADARRRGSPRCPVCGFWYS